jgi:UDP-4-amino-4,6-dideoxy-N-acetyl-beta-L-altrosamine transaminase
MIPYGRQDVTKSDIDTVTQVLQSDFLTQGPVTPKFEKKIAQYCGASYGVATNSATSALHIACLALGLREGDYMWTSPITFVASANCGIYCGAKVDFVDIDMDTYNISSDTLERRLIQAEKKGELPKIVIPVHFSGQSCEMEKIYKLSKKYKFKIIEDASHAIGGRYKEGLIGNCKYSDITVFSFHPVKIITTGEGGMALTNSRKLSEKMTLLRSHGITRNPNLMTQKPDGDWYYQQIGLGYNYRMTDIQAALGISQMDRLDKYIKKRNEIAKKYDNKLESLPIKIPYQHQDSDSAYHLYVILLNQEISTSKKTLFEWLHNHGVHTSIHYIPVHMQPYYQDIGYKFGRCPNAENYYQRAISLPIYPALSNSDQYTVIGAINNFFKQ